MATESNGIQIIEENVYILDEFDENLMKQMPAISNLYNKQSSKVEGSVTFHINSNGGYAHLVFHLIDLVEMYRGKVKTITYVHGRAYSAGSMLAIVGDERYISEYAEHLPHYGDSGLSSATTPLQNDRNHKHYKRHFNKILNLYKRYSSIPDIDKNIKDDCYFIDSEKAIKWKLADKLIQNKEIKND